MTKAARLIAEWRTDESHGRYVSGWEGAVRNSCANELETALAADLAALRAFHLDLSEVTIGADLDYQVERLAELIKKYGGDNDS